MSQYTQGSTISQPTVLSSSEKVQKVQSSSDTFEGLHFNELLDALSGVPITHIEQPLPEQLQNIH